jgi:hypothetical protein
MNTSRILVCLYSDANFLALNILENLLSKNSQVVVATDDLKKWRHTTSHLLNNSRFLIVDKKDLEKYAPFNYSVFCGGFISKVDGYKELKNFLNINVLESSKRLVVLPFETFSSKENDKLNVSDNLGMVYTGDLLGPRIDLESDLLINYSIREVLEKRELSLAVGEVLYPIFVSDAARTITKWIFSFGPYGREVFLLGPQVSGTDFWVANQKIVSRVSLNYDNKREPRRLPKGVGLEVLSTNLNFALLETYKWVGRPRVSVPSKPKVKKTIKYPKHFKLILFSVLTVVLFPLILMATSLGALYLSYRDFFRGRDDDAINKILIAKTLLVIGREQSSLFTYIPLLGSLYEETAYASDVSQEMSGALVTAIPLIREASRTFNSVLGDTIYDPTESTQRIAVGLDTLYQHAATIESQTQSAKNSKVLLARTVSSKINFQKIQNLFNQGRVLVTNLPEILGKGERKTYLVLFQNNMELRPTGGFIGSFGLLTFDGGRMTDLTVNDVYSADGQLRGHVEPPIPIKEHLNEANWWLRDSNWDPDFPTSAKRAEWFLDKEIGVQVDGVMAIDLETVVEILKISGPIFLADYNLDITSDNLYKETQSEVQDEFFPGSHQKASFITALSRNLIGEVEKLGEKQKLQVLASFLRDFEERHIQAFLHDDSSQNAISGLGWGGEVSQPSCGSNCYTDLIGLVEANFGFNKANYFITREVDLSVYLNQDTIERRLTLDLKNSANPALGQPGTYGVYVRTFIPNDSNLLGVKAISGDSEETLSGAIVESHGRKEVGVFVQVFGGQSKKIEYSWVTRLQGGIDPSSYGLYIRKQAGVGDDNWTINIDSTNPALTKPGVYTYNTVLARDFFLRLQK